MFIKIWGLWWLLQRRPAATSMWKSHLNHFKQEFQFDTNNYMWTWMYHNSQSKWFSISRFWITWKLHRQSKIKHIILATADSESSSKRERERVLTVSLKLSGVLEFWKLGTGYFKLGFIVSSVGTHKFESGQCNIYGKLRKQHTLLLLMVVKCSFINSLSLSLRFYEIDFDKSLWLLRLDTDQTMTRTQAWQLKDWQESLSRWKICVKEKVCVK